MLNLSQISPKEAFVIRKMVLPDTIKDLIDLEDWKKLDDFFLGACASNGFIFQFMQEFVPELKSLEFIISIRDAKNDYEEDGIWHDDGSRVFAFSLGLNLNPESIEGGNLLIRAKGSMHETSIKPPHFGNCILFKTGIHGYEHKVKAVTKGRRIVIAGWCTV
tara:strand:+ start:82333 stop:82818 length:486 start_codon:yes stop_codon:yes gene_type:complete